MAKAASGDTVQVRYIGRLADGTVFDSSEDAGDEVFKNFRGKGVQFSPLELVLGAGTLPPKVEEALVGLEPGQRVEVRVSPQEGFGPRLEERVIVVPASEIGPQEATFEGFRMADGRKALPAYRPAVGHSIEFAGATPARGIVTAIEGGRVTVDLNHPLAGKELVFDVRLVGITPRPGHEARKSVGAAASGSRA